jgi:gem associated protein 5
MAPRSNFVLYSCGGSKIFIHDPSKPEADAVNFNTLAKGGPSKFPPRTEFQWKADFSMLAVGNEDGSVDMYSAAGSKFVSIGVIVAHKKLIQSVRWHPQFTFQNSEPSKYQTWLAVASNDTNIKGLIII